MAEHPIFAPILQGWLAASTPAPRFEQPIAKAYRLSRTDISDAGIRLACRVILEHDPENDPEGGTDAGCYECSLGTVPKHRETGPCLFHAACDVIRQAGLEP